MAAQTVSVNRNLDDAAIAGLLNADAITINTNATLTCNSDNRWSQQAAVPGNITIDAVTGGKLLIDGRDVWQIPFTVSSGNVPALGTAGVYDVTGVTSTCQGEFLGVWATGEMLPRASGGTMPASGYIKLRRKSTSFTVGETVNLAGGATITATNTGKRSWINFVCTYQGTVNIPRLGSIEVKGDWYDLGTTDGNANQEFDYPFLDVCNGIQIETAPGSGVYEWYRQAGARWNSGTATLDGDTGIRAKYFGQRAASIVATTVNGSAVITTANTTELYVGMPINASANFANLALYIVAINPGVSFTVSSNANGAASTTFLPWRNKLKLAQSTGTVVGYLPASGCKVRCPNIKLSTSLGAYAGNILPTTQADRYEFVTTSAGVVVMDIVDCGWYSSFSAPYSLDFRRVAQSIGFIIANVATTTYIDDCTVGYENGTGSAALAISNCYGGGQILNSWLARYNASGAGDSAVSMTDCSDFTITNCIFSLGGTNSTSRLRGNADIRTLIMTRCFRVIITNLTVIMGRINVIGCIDVSMYTIVSCDMENGANPGTTNALAAVFDINTGSANILIDGYSFLTGGGITEAQPYNLWFVCSTGCADIEFLNAGTAASTLNCGTTQPTRSLISAAVSVGLMFRKLYALNTATGFGTIANTCQNVIIDNCWVDGGDSVALAGVNLTARGCRWTNSITGQTSVYGRHWEDAFTSTTTGRLLLCMNEPITETADQCTIIAGTPKFTSTGNIAMPSLNDEVVWEMPYFAIGHTALANTTPTVTGTNTANITFTYQIDLGNGWNGTWLAATGANLSSHTIPPYVDYYNKGGFKLKIRAVTTVANATNAILYARIDTITTATEYQRAYARRNPTIGPASVFGATEGAIFTDAGVVVSSIAYVAAMYQMTPSMETDMQFYVRLRRYGRTPYETYALFDKDEDVVLDIVQDDIPEFSDSIIGSSVITSVTDHGATPVTWQGKQYSITVISTGTMAQTVAELHYKLSRKAMYHGYIGLAWPTMLEPDGAKFKTVRGRLLGSAGATLKGVRILNNLGNALYGITEMMSDDGTSYVAPTDGFISVSGFALYTAIVVRNLTKATIVTNGIVFDNSWGLNYTNGGTFDPGDSYEVLLTCISSLGTALKPVKYTGTISESGAVIVADQEPWSEYITAGIDGSNISECTADLPGNHVDVNDTDNSTTKARIAAFIAYTMYNDSVARIQWFNAISYKSAGSAVIADAIAPIRVDNTKATPLNVIDSFQLRADSGESMVSESTYTINWDNSADAIVVAVGSGVTAQDKTDIINGVASHEFATGWSNDRGMRKLTALAVAKTSGNAPAGGTTIVRNLADTADEMSATVDANGNRTAVTVGP